MGVHKCVGKGYFSREDNWALYSCKANGYTYYINEVKNFDNRGYKIYKRDGGNEWVYILTRRKIGTKKVTGKRAYDIYCRIKKKRNKYRHIGYDTYLNSDTKQEYTFCLTDDDNKRYSHVPSETKLVIGYASENVSQFFPTFRECLQFAENKIEKEMSDKN